MNNFHGHPTDGVQAGGISPLAGRMASGGAATIAGLRARIQAIEADLDAGAAVAALPLGAAEIDDALPWGGLPLGRLHAVESGDIGGGAAAGFCAALLGRAARGDAAARPLLWCGAAPEIHGPGLAAFGLPLARLVVVRTRRPREVLWAMEEALRSRRVAAVLGEVAALDLTAGRRLQLAAAAGGGLALLLSHGAGRDRAATGAAVTRWRLAAAPSDPAPGPRGMDGVGRARWRVDLVRCRGGRPRQWMVEWNEQTHGFAVAAALADRPAVPALAAAGAGRRAG